MFLTGAVRIDGSSVFGEDQRNQKYFKGSGSYIISEHDFLEKFIDQQLKKLPEREAPDNLVANVLAALAARENRPWWKQPFTSWPRNSQAFLFAALSMVFAGVVYLAWRPAEANSTAWS